MASIGFADRRSRIGKRMHESRPTRHHVKEERTMTARISKTIAAAVTAVVLSAGHAGAADFFKLGSLAPGMSPFTINTAFASVVNKYVPDTKIQVSATGTAMRHQLLAAQGKMDFFMGSPIGVFLMYKQIGPYKKLKNGPEMVKKVAHIFTYELGPYTFVTYAGSGIKKLADLKGKNVFIGPPGGAATRVVGTMIKSQAGYAAGKDYKKINMGWSAAIQAFQDKKFDVLVVPANPPSPSIQQIALQNKIRLLSVDLSKQGKLLRTPGRTKRVIAADAYGVNQVNNAPIPTLGALVGLSVRANMPAEKVYAMTKAFWEHIGEVHAAAPWMKQVVNLTAALEVVPGRLHPGAEKYYREIGRKIPVAFQPGDKWVAK
jgi:TRAP transporter TAXI family solute receptor